MPMYHLDIGPEVPDRVPVVAPWRMLSKRYFGHFRDNLMYLILKLNPYVSI